MYSKKMHIHLFYILVFNSQLLYYIIYYWQSYNTFSNAISKCLLLLVRQGLNHVIRPGAKLVLIPLASRLEFLDHMHMVSSAILTIVYTSLPTGKIISYCTPMSLTNDLLNAMPLHLQRKCSQATHPCKVFSGDPSLQCVT